MHQVQLTILWLICCTCCFGIDNLSADQLLSTSTQQQSSTASTNSDSIDFQASSFLSRKQLIRLKKSISSVLEEMRTIESNLLEPVIDRNRLISLQRKANKRMQKLERRITKFILQSNTARPSDKVTHDDQIDQQLVETNAVKAMQDSQNFLSTTSSSTSYPLSPSVFLSVGAFSAPSTGNYPSINSGGLSSSIDYSTNSSSLTGSTTSTVFPAYSTSSSNISRNHTRFEKDEINRKLVKSFSNELDLRSMNRSEFLSRIGEFGPSKGVNRLNDGDKVMNHKLSKTKNKFNNLNKFSNHEFIAPALADHQIIRSRNRQRKQPFLLYHKCSKGYLQIGDNDSLTTGMNPDLFKRSEFLINYLPKFHHKHQLQIHTKQGKYLCLNDQGRAAIMDTIDYSLCTFDMAYHQNEFFQLNSVSNAHWTLGFSRKGVPIRATSHRRTRRRNTLNECTLFIRHRSDKQLLQRLVDFRRYETELKQKILAHNAQIKKIEKINNLQDSLIMSKIEKLGSK